MPRRDFHAGSFGVTVLALAFLFFARGGFSAPIFASSNYFVRSWQIEDGLPQNSVTAVVQTRDGYLWLGTYNGLARFDGVRFTVFDENNAPEMHNNRVTSLFEGDDGTLWIGHENGEVTRYKDGRFKAVKYKAAWNDGKIYDIGTDEAGDVWLLNESGQLARLKDGLVLTPQAGLASRLVDMTRSKDGHIWVARDGRVSLLEHGQLRALQFDAGATNIYVQGIGASRDGGVWIASDGYLRKWKGDKWVENRGPYPWYEAPISKIIETKNGMIAAGTVNQGIYLVFPGNSKGPAQFNHANGFPSDWVVSLLDDREGNLWIGTGGGGLAMLRKNIIDTLKPPDQWQERAVLTVNASQNGALWVGTEGAGLYHFEDGKWSNFGFNAGIDNPYVWSVAEDARGELWVGTWSSGLFMRHGDHFGPAPGLEPAANQMTAIFCEGPGKLWIGTGEGLLLYESGKGTWFGEADSVARKRVRAVIKDGQGAIWFGTYGAGLGCLKNGTVQQYRKADGLASDYIECLHLDDEGTLWIGTYGGGLTRLKQGRFAVMAKDQGLPNDVICDIQDDGLGFFWMSSYGGIIRVSKSELNQCADGRIKELHCVTYGLSDGLPTLECSDGPGCKTADGRLWFPTTKGLVTVDPANVTTNQLAPPVVIEAMLVDDQPVTNEVPAAILQIPPGRHRLEFQYAGLSLSAPDKVRFKYRLTGFETGWVDAGTKRAVDYNYIPPGDYSFQVTACNNDGVWNDAGTEIKFKVLPYFWQTLWFLVLAATVALSASGGIVWYNTRQRMRRKLERVERQRDIERERARIAHDIHDDLGAHLTRISMLSESVREGLNDPGQAIAGLNQIYDTANELTRSMDEIVWAVNPRHDTLESLTSYLEKFAQDLLATAGIRCRLDMPMQFPEWRLTSEVRHNLFLALKEALHNVVKHSAAAETYIRFTIKTTCFELAIEDNGRGFITATREQIPSADSSRFSSGNGLENMVRRLAEIGGRCNIQSAPGQGTKVIFTVPLKIFAA
ncbi:MAG: two-component regulator propeller domain-containing protein [Verrucomicrobiota bacterium]